MGDRYASMARSSSCTAGHGRPSWCFFGICSGVDESSSGCEPQSAPTNSRQSASPGAQAHLEVGVVRPDVAEARQQHGKGLVLCRRNKRVCHAKEGALNLHLRVVQLGLRRLLGKVSAFVRTSRGVQQLENGGSSGRKTCPTPTAPQKRGDGGERPAPRPATAAAPASASRPSRPPAACRARTRPGSRGAPAALRPPASAAIPKGA